MRVNTRGRCDQFDLLIDFSFAILEIYFDGLFKVEPFFCVSVVSGRHGGGRRRNRTRSPRPRCQFNYSSLFHFHVVIILCFSFGFNLYTRSSSLFFYVIIHAIFAAYSRSPSPARDDSRYEHNKQLISFHFEKVQILLLSNAIIFGHHV